MLENKLRNWKTCIKDLTHGDTAEFKVEGWGIISKLSN